MAFEQHEFSPGEKIGSYKVLRPVGMGAAGTVYEAEHELTGKKFALKAFTPRRGDLLVLKKKFLAEAKLMTKLDAPNIVKVYDSGVDDTTKLPFFVMAEVFPTPESADSSGNGTRILRSHFSGRPGVLVTLVLA